MFLLILQTDVGLLKGLKSGIKKIHNTSFFAFNSNYYDDQWIYLIIMLNYVEMIYEYLHFLWKLKVHQNRLNELFNKYLLTDIVDVVVMINYRQFRVKVKTVSKSWIKLKYLKDSLLLTRVNMPLFLASINIQRVVSQVSD